MMDDLPVLKKFGTTTIVNPRAFREEQTRLNR